MDHFPEKIHLNRRKNYLKVPSNWQPICPEHRNGLKRKKTVDTTNSDMAYQNALLELQVPS